MPKIELTKKYLLLPIFFVLLFILFELLLIKSRSVTRYSSQDKQLFIATRMGSKKYKAFLFDRETKEIKEKILDLTNIPGWILDTRFESEFGTDSVHYNPKTDEIILIYTNRSSGMESPPGSLPPPFYYAVYKTTFEPSQKLELIYSRSEEDPLIQYTLLDPVRNTLILMTTELDPYKHEIIGLDLITSKINKIAKIPTTVDSKEVTDISNMRLSVDGEKIYQILTTGTRNHWNDEKIYLITTNIKNGQIESREIFSGNNIQTDIHSLSGNMENIVFYSVGDSDIPTTSDDGSKKMIILDLSNNYNLYLKNIVSGKLTTIPLKEKVGNFNLFISGDGSKILYKLKSGCSYYDIKTKQIYNTPINYPILWSPSNNFILAEQKDRYILYDIINRAEIDLGLKIGGENLGSVVAAQWN